MPDKDHRGPWTWAPGSGASGRVAHERVPLGVIVMTIGLHREREHTRQIPWLDIDHALRLAGYLRGNVGLGVCCETCLRIQVLACQNIMNIMLKII
jgi:hypothetical protein